MGRLAPRLGLAWQPFGAGGRASVRGGYGWFYQAPSYSGNATGTPLFTDANEPLVSDTNPSLALRNVVPEEIPGL